MSYWIKNTKGEPSASLTMVVSTFSVAMLWWVSSIFGGSLPFEITPFDASEAMIMVGPTFGLYWGRRNTDARAPTATSPSM